MIALIKKANTPLVRMPTAANFTNFPATSSATAVDLSFQTYLEIASKKAQYGRYLDTKQWDKFHLVALPDAQFHSKDANGEVLVRNGKRLSFDSRDAFVKYFNTFFANAQTLHMFGPPQMVVESEESIKVTWAMKDQLCFSSGKLVELRGGGYYVETWIRQAEEWWLSSLVLTRSYTKIVPRDQSLL